MDWLGLAKTRVQGLAPAVDAYLADANQKQARKARNIREHGEKFQHGKGKNQDESIMVRSAGNTPNDLAIAGSATLILHGNYLIGGRYSVQDGLAYSRTILQAVMDPKYVRNAKDLTTSATSTARLRQRN